MYEKFIYKFTVKITFQIFRNDITAVDPSKLSDRSNSLFQLPDKWQYFNINLYICRF